jgi:hypothetical protein
MFCRLYSIRRVGYYLLRSGDSCRDDFRWSHYEVNAIGTDVKEVVSTRVRVGNAKSAYG